MEETLNLKKELAFKTEENSNNKRTTQNRKQTQRKYNKIGRNQFYKTEIATNTYIKVQVKQGIYRQDQSQKSKFTKQEIEHESIKNGRNVKKPL